MTDKEALRVLIRHNNWRRGDEELEMENPSKIGIAIDIAVLCLSNKIKKESTMAKAKAKKSAKPVKKGCK